MTQRNDILKDYFSLVNNLNQTNKFKNEKTQIVFEIEYQNNGRGVLYAKISEKQKIRICQQSSLNVWTLAGIVNYENFGVYVLGLLKEFSKQSDITIFNEYFFIKLNELLCFES